LALIDFCIFANTMHIPQSTARSNCWEYV